MVPRRHHAAVPWCHGALVPRSKGSLGHAFTVYIRTGNQNQTSFYPSVPHEISVLVELILEHLRYLLTDVPPQQNSPPDNVFRPDWPQSEPWVQKEEQCPASDSRNNQIPLVHTNSELAVQREGKAPEGTVPSPSPGRHAGAARAVHRQPMGSGLGPPCPALRANPFPKVTDPFCRLPLPTLFHRPEAVHLGDLMRL
ncbi:Regulator of rDNA transcription protein 15 [Capsicum annuum]|nr:Regulator of rDNA transcription protein 15 [Capsicum annuum]